MRRKLRASSWKIAGGVTCSRSHAISEPSVVLQLSRYFFVTELTQHIRGHFNCAETSWDYNDHTKIWHGLTPFSTSRRIPGLDLVSSDWFLPQMVNGRRMRFTRI